MHSTIGLLRLTNHQELPGFKINIMFDNSFESTLGFNKNETILYVQERKRQRMFILG
jgi:hypothetical protein